MTKVLNTEQLIDLAEEGWRKKFNRRLDPVAIAHQADPDGFHIAQILMIHEHIAGQAVAPHYRVRVATKVRGVMEPAWLILDMVIGSFDKLMDQEEFDRRLAEMKAEEASADAESS